MRSIHDELDEHDKEAIRRSIIVNFFDLNESPFSIQNFCNIA